MEEQNEGIEMSVVPEGFGKMSVVKWLWEFLRIMEKALINKRESKSA